MSLCSRGLAACVGCRSGLTQRGLLLGLRGNDTELIEKEDEAYKGNATVVRP